MIDLDNNKYIIFRYASSEYYSSTGREMTAILQRNVDSGELDDLEFMDISYYFHDGIYFKCQINRCKNFFMYFQS